MKKINYIFTVLGLFVLLTLVLFVAEASAQSNEFTYQGRLLDNAAPPTASYDFEFSLWDGLVSPPATQQGTTQTAPSVAVANGIFTVKLNFGAQFNGGARFLQIAVRPAGGGAYTTLAPRQPLTSAPYSIRSSTAANATSADALSAACVLCVIDAHILAIDGTKVTGTVANATNAVNATSATTAGNVTGVVAIANGGTGSLTQNFVDLTTDQSSIGGNKSFTGTLSGGIVSTGSQFNIGVSRVLAVPSGNLFAGLGTGANTSGPNNTFVGTQAGEGTTSGNNNSFFGRRAGFGNIVGSNNTLIGAATSMPAGDLNFATAIGAGSSVSTNNTLVLGRPIDTVQVAGSLSGDGSGLTNVPGTLKWQTVSGPTQQAQPNNGYLATNDAQVTITLPASPNIGDVIRVSSVGLGGWKIAQNAGQSILGVNIGLIGTNWTPRESNRNWFSVASSADGTKLVAAVLVNGQIYTSTDSGVSWTPRESNRFWSSVASSVDGTKLVATVVGVSGTGGRIYTSTDSGVSWTPSATNRQWLSVASSADGTKLVAGENSGGIYTSTDSGVSWTPRPIFGTWQSVASSADGTKLVAVDSSGQIYTSTDSGVSWTPRETARSWQSVASSADGTKLVAVASGGQIYTSTDSGVNWTSRESNRSWQSVASSADGTKLVAVVSGGQIYTSIDSGVNWTPLETNRNWQSVASSADGTKLVAVVGGGQIYTSSANTTTGTAGYLTGGQYTAIELQYIGNGQFLPISHTGVISAF